MIVRPERSAHYYLPDGKPFYTIECKTKPGQFRSPTIRDAMAVGAVPSVTTILRVLAKPGLEDWKRDQAILSAITLPRLPNENDHDFAQRVAVDMEQESEKARQAGTNLHSAIEEFLSRGVVPMTTSPEKLAVEAFRKWYEEGQFKVVHSEQAFACAEFGGRVDLVTEQKAFGLCIIDIKTQGTRGGKFKRYPEWVLQLVGYRIGLGLPEAELLNLVFSTTEPGLMEVVNWSDEAEEAEAAWWNVVKLWQWQNNWTPAKVAGQE